MILRAHHRPFHTAGYPLDQREPDLRRQPAENKRARGQTGHTDLHIRSADLRGDAKREFVCDCMNDPVMYVDESGEVTQKGTPPPPSSGYQPPKGKKPGDAWNKERKGWEDKNGNIWVPDRAGHGINRQNGDSDHWDVQNKDGTGYINVGADGNKWGGRGKAPKIPEKNNVSKTEIDIIPVIVTLLLMVTIAISLAAIPATGGTSLIILSIV